LNEAIKREIIPLKILFEKLFDRKVEADLFEDNAACITSVQKGYSPAMRYIGRTQKVQLGFLHDVCQVCTDEAGLAGNCGPAGVKAFTEEVDEDKPIKLKKVVTTEQKADIFTKDMDKIKFRQLSSMIGMRQKSTIQAAMVALNLAAPKGVATDTPNFTFEAVD